MARTASAKRRSAKSSARASKSRASKRRSTKASSSRNQKRSSPSYATRRADEAAVERRVQRGGRRQILAIEAHAGGRALPASGVATRRGRVLVLLRRRQR